MENMGQSAGKRYWLAGIIDSDGCISLHKRTRNTKNRTYDLIPEIVIVNTNWLIIDGCRDALEIDSIGHWIGSMGFYGVRPGKKPRWKVRIYGLKRCNKFLSIYKDLLIGKKREAEALLYYTTSRLSKEKHSPYSDNEIQAYNDVKVLKTVSNPNDYTLSYFDKK